MSKEKIEEMARACCWGGARKGKTCKECFSDSLYKPDECEWKTRVAKALYNAGYRKQSEGVWLPQWEGSRLVKCSVCGYEYCDLIECGNFCGNCGARMSEAE